MISRLVQASEIIAKTSGYNRYFMRISRFPPRKGGGHSGINPWLAISKWVDQHMLHASTKKLIDRLSEMTELGKLDWTEGGDGNITFATEGYSVSLIESPNEVVIASLDGIELERATVDELAATQLDDGTAYTAIVAAMTKEASRVARGTEAAISSLLAGMQDAPEEISGDEVTETPEALQEDLGDETAIVTAEAIEVSDVEDSAETLEAEIVEEDSPAEIGASWKDSVETETAVAEELEPEDAVDAEAAEAELVTEESSDADPEPAMAVETETEVEAETDAVIETSSAEEEESEPDHSAEPDSTEEIEAATVEVESDEVETDANLTPESEPETELELQSEDQEAPDTVAILADDEVTEEVVEESSTLVSDAQIEASETDETEEVETAPVATFGAATEIEPETVETVEAETETEADVSDAVARIADEVNADDSDEDSSGLATAAASAVGAVALAAGLTPQSSDDDPVEEAEEESIELVEAEAEPITEAESTEAPPAYVPFGLEANSEEDASIEEDTSIEETVPEAEAPVETVIEVEAATESEIVVDLETPASPTAELAQMVDDALAPHEAAPSEFEADSSFTVEVEPEDGEVGFASADTAPETETIEDTAFAPSFQSEEDTESVDEAETAEAVEESVLVKSTETTEPEESEPQGYSLSGIGAGFGLGALSAKTEASGIPSVSEPTPASDEKVIIDATDDVLPKPEGNLNVALAETASAAVSAANAEPALETANAEQGEAEAEADILKPRTRFNPWD